MDIAFDVNDNLLAITGKNDEVSRLAKINKETAVAKILYSTGQSGLTGITLRGANLTNISDQESSSLPDKFMLAQNYPNPFNPKTSISFYVPTNSNVILSVYDLAGKEIKRLVDESKKAGQYKVSWDATDAYGAKISSGVYFYSIRFAGKRITKKMLLLK